MKRSRPAVVVPRVITGCVPCAINSTAAGRVSELLVAADLIARGWHVFFPLDYRKGHDLIACGNGRIVSFEVRSGHRGKTGRLCFQRNHIMRSDHYAVAVTGEPVAYEPALENLGDIDYRRRDHRPIPADPKPMEA